METKTIFTVLALTLFSIGFQAVAQSEPDAVTGATSAATEEKPSGEKDADKPGKKFMDRLTVGGYGEAVMTYNMYSDNFGIYSSPEAYRDSPGHGRFDLPHVVLMLGYDFGKGWSLGMEIEFEHGGVEAAVERENEEAGESWSSSG